MNIECRTRHNLGIGHDQIKTDFALVEPGDLVVADKVDLGSVCQQPIDDALYVARRAAGLRSGRRCCAKVGDR